ncbi:MAG: hypothetical protein ACOCTG_06310 [Bacteroidota bacterium]
MADKETKKHRTEEKADLPRETESNDPEWHRAGGTEEAAKGKKKSKESKKE